MRSNLDRRCRDGEMRVTCVWGVLCVYWELWLQVGALRGEAREGGIRMEREERDGIQHWTVGI